VAEVPRATSPLAASIRSDLLRRARNYLMKVPPAVSGEGGHNQTFKAACILMRFGLTQEEALEVFREWNETCQPPWEEKELLHKLEDAERAEANRGYLPGQHNAALPAVGSGFRADFLTSAALEQMDARHRWLVKHVLVRDQPVLLGGPKKSLKTSLLLDAALSLGTGRPFLGKFEVPERVRVAVLSGESGQITIRETALRVAQAKGVKLAACDVLWGFELPRLGVEEDLVVLSAALRDNGVGVVFIDPAYLCLLAGTPDFQANNMFQVGPLLLRVAKICSESGTTLVLVHHTTKPAGMVRMQAGEPLELEDLAYSGFQEFARQWLLVNRRQKYEPGSGQHLLWLNVGGSAGHSGCWGVDVEEGRLNDDFGGRGWLVRVRSMDDAVRAAAQQKERARDAKKRAKLDELKAKLRQVLLELPGGETVTRLAQLVGESRTTAVAEALAEMREDGTVLLGEVVKQAGRRKQTLPAWRLKTAADVLTARAGRGGLPLAGGLQGDEEGVSAGAAGSAERAGPEVGEEVAQAG
jgi:replicative DNA helicase